jgi:hypothetical protein
LGGTIYPQISQMAQILFKELAAARSTTGSDRDRGFAAATRDGHERLT